MVYEGKTMPKYPKPPANSVFMLLAACGATAATVVLKLLERRRLAVLPMATYVAVFGGQELASRAVRNMALAGYDLPIMRWLALGKRQRDWWITLSAFREAGGTLAV